LPSSESSCPLSGQALLEAVTDAIVALHLSYYGRIPATAKTLLLGDDLLACTLGGIYTDVEKTMIELQRAHEVHATRKAFQAATRAKYINAIQRLSGRTVLAFISNYHVGPDLAVELFMLEPPPISVPGTGDQF
jgi:uncharacterized protein YbcI